MKYAAVHRYDHEQEKQFQKTRFSSKEGGKSVALPSFHASKLSLETGIFFLH